MKKELLSPLSLVIMTSLLLGGCKKDSEPISPAMKPSVPELIRPVDTEGGVINPTVLAWHPSKDAKTYSVQISESPIFSPLVYDQSSLACTTVQITNLNNSSAYYWRVKAENEAGGSDWQGKTRIFYTHSPCKNTPTVNYAGKTYNTVQIGNQCWLKENLDIGSAIKLNTPQVNNSIIEKWCLDDDTAKCSEFGGLYSWAEALAYTNGATNNTSPDPPFSGNVQGICPPGWHIPAFSDFNQLIKYTNYQTKELISAGIKMYESNISTNKTGFTARVPKGFEYFNMKEDTGPDHTNLFFLETSFNQARHIYILPKYGGSSVRCIRD